MGIQVAENLGSAHVYHFTDPDAFLACDNPLCSAPWVTRPGLVVWALEDNRPSGSRFTDRLLVACSMECLAAAQSAHGRRGWRWSKPMPVAAWLDALRVSLDVDPASTPIGEFAGAV